MPLLSNSDEKSIHPFFQLTCLTVDFLWIAFTRLSQFSSWCQQFLRICYRILKHQWIRNISITEKTCAVQMPMEVSVDTMKCGTYHHRFCIPRVFCIPFHVNWNHILKVSGIIYWITDFWLNHKFFSVWTVDMKWILLDNANWHQIWYSRKTTNSSSQFWSWVFRATSTTVAKSILVAKSKGQGGWSQSQKNSLLGKDGCILSPSYNILAEAMMHKTFYNCRCGLHTGDRLTNTWWYADDIVSLATSPEDLQEVVNRVATAGI